MQLVRFKKGSSEAGPSRLPLYLGFISIGLLITLPDHPAVLTIGDTSDDNNIILSTRGITRG